MTNIGIPSLNLKVRYQIIKPGIDAAIARVLLVHLQRAYSDLGYNPGSFAHAKRAAKPVLSCRFHPEISSQAVAEVRERCGSLLQAELQTVWR